MAAAAALGKVKVQQKRLPQGSLFCWAAVHALADRVIAVPLAVMGFYGLPGAAAVCTETVSDILVFV